MTFGRHEQPDIMMLADYFDIGFIPCVHFIDLAFVFKVKLMTIKGSGVGIINNGLIRDFQIEHMSEDMGSFSGGDRIRDMKGKDKSQGMKIVVDFG